MNQPMQVLTSNESQEWYTPPKYVEMVRAVLGAIDLDPASNPIAQKWIEADNYLIQDGLEAKWDVGSVFCNPPYGKSNGKSSQAVWSAKMVAEFRQGNFAEGILLVNSTHGYKWYEQLWSKYVCCLVTERIRFVKPDGTTGGQAKRGQTFVYFGGRPEAFEHYFSTIGRIIYPD